MIASVLLFAGGLIVLIAGAEMMVRGASKLALALGVSAAIVGLTIVAYGTSAPELVVGVIASLEGSSTLVYGNVIGSNIANLALVLGIALLLRPIPLVGSFLKKQVPLLIGITLLLVVLSLNRWIGLTEGVLLLALLVAYLIGQIGTEVRRVRAGKEPLEAPAHDVPKKATGSKAAYALLVVLGLAGLVIGAEMMVRGAVAIATTLGVSQRVIGITVVAVGTSLPELATVVAASVKRETDLLLGGLVGSNVFNILIILGVCSTLAPIDLSGETVTLDFAFLLGVPVVLYAFVLRGKTLSRWIGALLLAGYISYMGLLWLL